VEKDGVVQGDFSMLFATKKIFRKDTGIKKFDYICVAGNDTIDPGGKLVFNETLERLSVRIYDMREAIRQ